MRNAMMHGFVPTRAFQAPALDVERLTERDYRGPLGKSFHLPSCSYGLIDYASAG